MGDDERSLPTATVAYNLIAIRGGDVMEIAREIRIGDGTATTFKNLWQRS
jgi:hypothetical protein